MFGLVGMPPSFELKETRTYRVTLGSRSSYLAADDEDKNRLNTGGTNIYVIITGFSLPKKCLKLENFVLTFFTRRKEACVIFASENMTVVNVENASDFENH